MSDEMMQQVLRLAARGWLMFPCESRGKRPLVTGWPNQATNEESRLRFWTQRFPKCNWAVATGPESGVFVLDVDGEEGTKSLLTYEAEGRRLPKTLMTRTGRGSHLWLAWSLNGCTVRNSAGMLAPGLDVRGAGGYVIVPPSVHPSGTAYEFLNENVPIAPSPEWLLEEIAPIAVFPNPLLGTVGQGQGKTIPEGRRNDALTSLAGTMRRKCMTLSSIEAALLAENRERCSPPLAEAEVREIARSIYRYQPISVRQTTIRRRPELLTLSLVEPREVDWVWRFYLASGMLAMLSGDPGAGKTFVSLAIAAAITVGHVPYTDEPSVPADVLYLSVENSPEHVIRPRFDSLRGDPRRFHLLRGSLVGDGEQTKRGTVRLSDVELLNDALQQTKARPVIVDPIQSYLGPDVDAHRSNETRPVMDGLSRLAEEHSCCILLVRHLSKVRAGRALYQGLGSIDLTGAVRTELLAGCSPDNPNQRALVQVKSNLAQFGPSLGYAIDTDGIFRWTGESQLTSAAILAPESNGEGAGALAEAETFLSTALAKGPRPATDVQSFAKEEGISPRTLKRAKEGLEVQSRKSSMDGPWEWSLPEGVQQ